MRRPIPVWRGSGSLRMGRLSIGRGIEARSQIVGISRPSRRRGPRSWLGYGSGGFAYLLNAPSVIAISLLVGYPILNSIWISLHRYNLKRPRIFAFIGLENYADIL